MQLRPGLLFFLQFAVLSAPGRFSAVWLASLGLSESEVGFILFLPILVSLVTLAPLGALADSIEDGHRRILIAGNCVSCIAIQVLGVALAKWQSHRATLIAASLLFTIFRVVRNPVHPILDAYTLRWLELSENKSEPSLARPSKERYGQERMMGAVSMGATSVILGVASDFFGFSALFRGNLLSTFVLVAVLVAWKSPSYELDRGEASKVDRSEREADPLRGDVDSCTTQDEQPSQSDIQPLELIMSVSTEARPAIFFFTCASISVGTDMVENLLFLFMVKDLGTSNTLCGVALAITVATEIPLFYFSEKLLRKFSSRSLMLVGMLAYIVRVLFYAQVKASNWPAWLTLLAEPLHGVTYGLVQLASVHETSNLAPPHLQTTAQGLLATTKTIGQAVGTLGGSFLMQKYSSVVAYRAAASLVAGAGILYALSSEWNNSSWFSWRRGWTALGAAEEPPAAGIGSPESDQYV